MDSATSETHTLSLHDALPISRSSANRRSDVLGYRIRLASCMLSGGRRPLADRSSTRLNSSHRCISYAVFCLKKKDDTFVRFREIGYIAITVLRLRDTSERSSR